jgi:hypothetical protein
VAEEVRSGFDAYIKRIMEENKELLESLGSDFDEEGIPYWEKWGKPVDSYRPDKIESADDNN